MPDLFDSHVATSDLAEMTGFDLAFVENAIGRSGRLPGLNYRSATDQENADIAAEARMIIDGGKIESEVDRVDKWETGWGEVLERIKKDGVSTDTLTPQYFRHHFLRWRGKYIFAENIGFEQTFYTHVRRLMFSRFLGDMDQIIEFGCGTGTSLMMLRDMYPNVHLVGCDWAAPSQEIIAEINDETDARIDPVNFNMRNLAGLAQLDFRPETAIVTLHSMEQLGAEIELFLDMLLTAKPRLCLHLEPILEFYDPAVEFDNIAIEYHNKRNYLSGFYNKLIQMKDSAEIDIIQARRLGYGSTFQEAYSLIVWRPL